MQTFLFHTALGWMAGVWSSSGLKALILPRTNQETALEELSRELRVAPSSLPAPSEAVGPARVLVDEIERYIAEERLSFSVTIDWTGYTPFQRRVLEIVKDIPHGEVRSYSQVALEAGCPLGARAVGGVMRANRTPLVIPCHRVLNANGALGGFSGGLGLKETLLQIEKCTRSS